MLTIWPKRFILVTGLMLALMIIAMASAARADAIDGDWCLLDKHLNIKGPLITFGGGKSGQGQYTRHSFDYTYPAGDREAGLRLVMTLLSEEAMRLVRLRDGKQGEPELWKRCSMQTSSWFSSTNRRNHHPVFAAGSWVDRSELAPRPVMARLAWPVPCRMPPARL